MPAESLRVRFSLCPATPGLTAVIYRPWMATNSPAIELASKATPNDKTAKTSKVISIITGDVAGPTRFQQLSEGSITTPVDRDIRGKFLLLDFGGRWCPYCVKFGPQVKATWEGEDGWKAQLQDKGIDAEVILVSCDKPQA